MDKQTALDSLYKSLATLAPDARPARFLVDISPPSYDPDDFIVKSQIVINGLNVGTALVEMK